MARLTRIYTRKGDRGSTRLGSGRQVAKDAPRVEAYGSVDELNAVLGLCLSAGPSQVVGDAARRIQNELFDLGADLAVPADEQHEVRVPRIAARHVTALEVLIDELNEEVGPLDNFILPGGCETAALLHLARTVCRRAERRLVSLVAEEEAGAEVIAYINRLSDALFVMARYENLQAGAEEPLWEPGR